MSTPSPDDVERQWPSIDRWVQDHMAQPLRPYARGFNDGLEMAVEMWREERERWDQARDQLAALQADRDAAVALLRDEFRNDGGDCQCAACRWLAAYDARQKG